MQDGIVFPPVRVWWDGDAYWLSDGFHRIAAAERAGFAEIRAEVHHGCLSDAQWDSYSVNTSHGLRRTATEAQRVIHLALQHPRAGDLSNLELARHLHIPETTLRRWRKRLSSPRGEDKVRIVTRGKATYPIATARIGANTRPRRTKSFGDLRSELEVMRGRASPKARRLLNTFGNWALGCASPSECLQATESIVND